MPAKESNDDKITITNVEETVQKAIKKYFDIGMIIDAMFWKRCLPLLKEKWISEAIKKCPNVEGKSQQKT